MWHGTGPAWCKCPLGRHLGNSSACADGFVQIRLPRTGRGLNLQPSAVSARNSSSSASLSGSPHHVDIHVLWSQTCWPAMASLWTCPFGLRPRSNRSPNLDSSAHGASCKFSAPRIRWPKRAPHCGSSCCFCCWCSLRLPWSSSLQLRGGERLGR